MVFASGTLSGCVVSITLAGGGANAQPPANGLASLWLATADWREYPATLVALQPAILYSWVVCSTQIKCA